ncbi:3-oxoacyl-[acyl-carrier-protein] synthase [Photobacterium aphoticum]|uniref:3-oxoacyl-[acyl-carrier-protein] synthase n=1 Tax=Photobacterium aphoticum TaxID=754436 RepID=A0A090QPS3_9GAMM|nr:3-oxoacyl-[acyl-carrier-protein] synthase [Photobacterium aphoticum]
MFWLCVRLSVADQHIKTGMAKNVLVIGADALSHKCDPEDRSTIILFGDAAGAVVLGASEEPGIISTHLHADGHFGGLLSLAVPDHGQDFSADKWLYMAGNEVFKVAVTQLSNLVKDTLTANNMDKSELDCWCLTKRICALLKRQRRNCRCRWIKWL